VGGLRSAAHQHSAETGRYERASLHRSGSSTPLETPRFRCRTDQKLPLKRRVCKRVSGAKQLRREDCQGCPRPAGVLNSCATRTCRQLRTTSSYFDSSPYRRGPASLMSAPHIFFAGPSRRDIALLRRQLRRHDWSGIKEAGDRR
jgi:hypothetical protein